jgi:hypothetical protein
MGFAVSNTANTRIQIFVGEAERSLILALMLRFEFSVESALTSFIPTVTWASPSPNAPQSGDGTCTLLSAWVSIDTASLLP